MHPRGVGFVFAPVGLLLLSAAGDLAPAWAADESASSPPPPVAAPVSAPASVPAADAAAGSSPASDAAAALRASQDLEGRLIELRREVDGLEKQHPAWGDVRSSLDELTSRVDELARRLDAPPEPFPAPTPPEAPPEGGLQFRSRGGGASLRPSLRLQAGYEGALVDRGPGQPVAPDRSGFLLRHAELLLEGHVVHSRFEYRLLVDFAEPVIIKDAFVQARAAPWLAMRVGRFKLPFGFQRYLRSTYYDFVDRSDTMNAFSLERDVGVMVVARPLAGRLQFQVAATNGRPPRYDDGVAVQGRWYGDLARNDNDNLDLAYTARAVAAPWGPLPDSEGDLIGQRRPRVSVGVAGYYNLLPTDVVARTNNPAANTDVDGNGRVDNVAVWQGGIELRAHFRGAAVQAELFRRREHPGAAAADRSFAGEYLQASYLIVPHYLQVAVRIERTDLPLYGAPRALRLASGTRVDAQTVGVSAFLRGHDLKLQVEYSHLTTSGATAPAGVYSPDSHRLRASAQLIF